MRSLRTPRTREATQAAAVARRSITDEKLAIARPKWRDRNFTADQISAECGLSRRTLYTSLGPRWESEEGAQHASDEATEEPRFAVSDRDREMAEQWWKDTLEEPTTSEEFADLLILCNLLAQARRQGWEAAIAAERERCAAIVHRLAEPYLGFPDREIWELGQKIAEEIENVD